MLSDVPLPIFHYNGFLMFQSQFSYLVINLLPDCAMCLYFGGSPGESRVWSWPGSFGQKLLIPESRESQKKKQNLQEDEDPQGKPQEW